MRYADLRSRLRPIVKTGALLISVEVLASLLWAVIATLYVQSIVPAPLEDSLELLGTLVVESGSSVMLPAIFRVLRDPWFSVSVGVSYLIATAIVLCVVSRLGIVSVGIVREVRP